jgi:formylglycine-generating enzyme required for sulfatase activity
LFDMLGNMYEWCQDKYRPYQSGEGKEATDQIKEIKYVSEDPRLLRGGSFIDLPSVVRSALRFWVAPSVRDSYVGFRPSRTYP